LSRCFQRNNFFRCRPMLALEKEVAFGMILANFS